MRLNASDLERLDACFSQVDLFRQHFGEGGTVTLAKVRKVASLFDWDWAAKHLLSKKSRTEYKRVEASARTEYERVKASALAEYDRVDAEYHRARASAWAEYDRAKDSARAEYHRAKAPAWFAGWKKDHSK